LKREAILVVDGHEILNFGRQSIERIDIKQMGEAV
jgi:hypothetical protein